jgi:putative copper export protein
MDALSKASLYLGSVLLIGAGYFGLFVGPSKTRELHVGASLGFVLLVFFSNLNLVQTVYNILKRFDLNFIWHYATSTQHGHLTFIRLGLALLLLILLNLSGLPKARAIVFVLASLWLLSTFSQLSHATTMQGKPAMLADLLHFSAATLWSGIIVYSVINKIWHKPDFEGILKRVSRLALVSVLLLLATGIYTSQIHIQSFDALISTIYGRRLMIKLGIFLLVLGLAGINRWYLMPRLKKESLALKWSLLVEAVLLVGILGLTGLLTVSPVPHEM